MVTPIPSFLVLKPNVPVRLRVRGVRQEEQLITDPETQQTKPLSVFLLDVTEVDGQPRVTTFSITSYNLQQALTPYIQSGELFRRILQVTKRGAGRGTKYEFQLL